MKTLIFDFDGTIADSFETLLGVFEQPLIQILKYLKIKPWQVTWLALKAKRKIGQRIDSIKPFSGLPEVIKQLHQDGYQTFILSTNSSATIDRFLKANGLDGCFNQVYGDIGLRGKAGALKKIIKKHRLNKADCTYIGDEVRDVEAAKKVGIASVSVGWGFNYPEALQKANPSAIALKPKDLLKILEGWSGPR